MKLRRELGAGCAGADDGEIELPGAHRPGLRVSADQAVDEPLVKPDRLLRRVERDRVLLDSGSSEIIAPAADRDDEAVVLEGARRRDLLAFGIEAGAEMDSAVRPIEADHLADAILEMVLVGLGEVVDGVGPDIHAAGRDFMEQGLPDVSTGAIDERDLGPSALRERVAEPGDELKAGGAAADDDDPVRYRGRSRAFGRTRTHVGAHTVGHR